MEGTYYTPPQPRPFLAQIAQAVMMGGLLLVVSGEGTSINGPEVRF